MTVVVNHHRRSRSRRCRCRFHFAHYTRARANDEWTKSRYQHSFVGRWLVELVAYEYRDHKGYIDCFIPNEKNQNKARRGTTDGFQTTHKTHKQTRRTQQLATEVRQLFSFFFRNTNPSVIRKQQRWLVWRHVRSVLPTPTTMTIDL